MLSVAGVATAASTAAYLATRPRPTGLPDPQALRIAQLEKRLADLEHRRSPAARDERVTAASLVHKPYAVTHYETLASQVAHERQIAEIQRRLAAIEGYARG